MIGGALDYRILAEMNRPKEADAMRQEVLRLASSGLTAQDIHTALRIDLRQVREWLLVATPDEAARFHAEAWRA